jgi:hypothetical protein
MWDGIQRGLGAGLSAVGKLQLRQDIADMVPHCALADD